MAIDLTSASARQRLLAVVGQAGRRVLIIAEGVLPYLSAQEVAAIAADLYEEPSITHWIVDFDVAALGWAPAYRTELRAVPRRFQMPHMLAFLRFAGWHPLRQVGAGEEAARLHRPYPVRYPRRLLGDLLPLHWRAHIENHSGVALLTKV